MLFFISLKIIVQKMPSKIMPKICKTELLRMKRPSVSSKNLHNFN